MARTIQEHVAERGIQDLAHFTREANLKSILANGLVPRDHLPAEVCNDQLRIDGTHAVCASISWPNYKMFYRLRQENPGVDWVVLAIDPSVLWETRCAFCVTNAASTGVTSIPLEERMSLAAFKAMFGDFNGVARGALALPDDCPTNPQAEVLLLDGVPPNYILGAWARSAQQKARLEATYEGLEVLVSDHAYSPRKDYAHWK